MVARVVAELFREFAKQLLGSYGWLLGHCQLIVWVFWLVANKLLGFFWLVTRTLLGGC